MADFNNLILTNKGKELDAKIKTGEKTLKFTKIEVGDGELNNINIEDMTSLINKKYDIPINNIRIKNENIVIISFDVTNFADELTWTELGLIAEDPDTEEDILFLYGNAENKAETIAAKGSSSVIEKFINIELYVSNAEKVTAVIDDTLVYVPRKEFKELSNELHEQVTEEVSNIDANDIVFEDGETYQEKYENGEFNGDIVPNDSVFYYDGEDVPEGYEVISNDGIPTGGSGEGNVTGDTVPIGAIQEFAGEITPNNWLICDGSAISRTEYDKLFEVIGTTYGEGDGSTTFNLPDMSGKVAVGLDITDTDFNILGKTGGEKEHTLTIDEMPEHNHTFSSGGQALCIDTNTNATESGNGFTHSNSSSTWWTSHNKNVGSINKTGNSQPVSLLQPYTVTNYIIKAKQSAGVIAEVVDNLESESTTNALSVKQGKLLNEKIENIDVRLPIIESGVINTAQFTADNKEGSKMYYKLTFKNTYSETPNVLITYWNNAPTSFGTINWSVGAITKTDCYIYGTANATNIAVIGVQYMVIGK